VPVPGTPDTSGIVERLGVQAKHIAEAMQRVEPRKARSYDRDIELPPVRAARRGVSYSHLFHAPYWLRVMAIVTPVW
jgi:hypothetical protein